MVTLRIGDRATLTGHDRAVPDRDGTYIVAHVSDGVPILVPVDVQRMTFNDALATNPVIDGKQYRGLPIRHTFMPLTRNNQRVNVIYVNETATLAFWTVDGDGRFYYETVDEAIDDHLNAIDRIVVMHGGFHD